jgi:hypothetical protein
LSDDDANAPSQSFVVFIDEASKDVEWPSGWLAIGKRTKTTLYPLFGFLFQEPCSPIKTPLP